MTKPETARPARPSPALPLTGLRVIDLGHTVMGPTAGLVLADLGAQVIRLEPVGGDATRTLKGFGTGYFPFFNRNKVSLALNLKQPDGLAIARQLIATADILIENFGPGTMERLGLGYEDLKAGCPRLIYLSLKGFSKGPYEDRVALDEVVQMMSGLAFMTGPPGQPLRAGSSVVDILGGVFGVIAVQAALRQREQTGRGQKVGASLFEAAMFLMGQHLAYAARSDAPVPPMPARVSAWAVYDQFTTADEARVFLGITSDRHWQRFCETFDRPDLAADATLATNHERIAARDRLIPIVAGIIAALGVEDVSERAIAAKLPFAEIAHPEQLFDDPHLNAAGKLAATRFPDGTQTKLPLLPLELSGQTPGLHGNPPPLGNATKAVLAELGYDRADIDDLARRNIVQLEERS